ncbi:NADH-quinone oxidoreductase subunit C [Streptomyces anulatus]
MSDSDQRTESAAETYGRLPGAVTDLFGDEATAESAYDLLTVDVPAADWLTALRTARDELGCTYFDWLSAVDEPGTGFRVCAHVAALGTGTVRRLMVRTTVPHDAAVLPSAIDVYAGAAWHERETHEMFGVAFDGHPHLVPLLLPEGFEGHPLRKDFVLAARVAKAWPGAKEPGEPAEGHTGPKRRAMLPPGVPDPNEWGPLKGQLPPAAARPGRAARPAADRPPRRTRTAGEGSAAGATRPPVTGAGAGTAASAAEGTPADTGPTSPVAPEVSGPPPQTARPRRSRSASEGSASQQAAGREPAGRRQAPDVPEASPASPSRVRSTDAPWHDAQPAFDEPDADRPASPDEPSQPLRRLRSGGTGAEPPVREGAGRGEAPRSGPTAGEPAESAGEPAPTDEPAPDEATPAESTDEPAPGEPAPTDGHTLDKPAPGDPTLDHPAGGDPE